MMNPPVVRIINRPNVLKQRASQPGGRSFEDLVERGNQVVAENYDDYRTVALSDVLDLRSLLDRIKTAPAEMEAHVQGVFRISHDMKGQASTFGYPMITGVADSLCRFLERIETMDRAPAESAGALTSVIALHIDALHLLLTHDMKGSGGEMEKKLLNGLTAAAEKIIAGLRSSGA